MASKLIFFIVAALMIIGSVQCSNKKSNNPETSRGNLDTPQEKDDHLKDHVVNPNVEAQDEVALNRHKRYLNKKQEEVVVVKETGYGGNEGYEGHNGHEGYGEHGGHGEYGGNEGYEEHGGYGEHEGYGEHGVYGGHREYGHGHGGYGGYRG